MSQVWLRGPVCGVDNCRSRLYRLSAGRKFCQFGHIMEGNFEFDDDDGDLYVQTRRLNILLTDTGFGSSAARASPAAVSTAAAKRLYGHSGKIHLLKCLQYVLKKVTPRVVRLLYPYLQTAHIDDLTRELMLVVKLLWVRCVSKALAGASLRLADVYVVIYLGLRQLNRYPVYVEDMISILKQNKVPYISALQLLPKDMLLILSPATVGQLTNSAIPVDDIFYNQLGRLAVLIAPAQFWHTLAEYFYANAFTLFADLHLDAPTLIVVYHRISRSNRLFQHVLKSSGPLGFPDGRCIGLMYLTIKLYFVSSPVVVDIDQWMLWISNSLRMPFADHRHHHMDIKALLSLSDEQTNNYCDWVQDNLLSWKDKEVESESSMQSRLYKIFKYDEELVGQHESSEVPFELPKRKNIAGPPFRSVRNALNSEHVAKVEKELGRYFCLRYGLKQRSLEALVDLAEKQLVELMGKDGLLE